MSKLLKYVFIFVLFGGLTFGVSYAATSNDQLEIEHDDIISNYPYIDQLLLESSRYTQTDEVDEDLLEDYHENYMLSYTEAELDLMGYELMFDTPEVEVYFELNSFSIMMKNKETGYFWSSRPEFQDPYKDFDNRYTRNNLNSGLWFDFASVLDPSVEPTRITSSIYNVAEVMYQDFYDGDELTTPLHIQPYIIRQLSYKKTRIELTMLEQTDDAFTVFVNDKFHKFSFNIEISLNDGALQVKIPNETIVDTEGNYRLLAIHVFPYFGSTRWTSFPGYAMIPDGVGALVRTDHFQNVKFQATFYGGDYGMSNEAVAQLTLPIYGMIHEPSVNGYYANIIEGAEHATLIGDLGKTTVSHQLGVRYNYRNIYRKIINRAGDGSNVVSSSLGETDFTVLFNMLSNEDATYVGMANDYRDYLIEQEVLNADQEQSNNGNIPIQLSYIMQDKEPAFVGTLNVEMTTPNQVALMYNYFNEQGLTNQVVSLMGWSRDGFSLRAPYRTTVRNEGDYEDLIDTIIEDDNTIYFDNHYVISSELSRVVSYNKDVARNLSRLKMTRDYYTLNGQVSDIYYLYPDRSYALAKSDVSYFESLGLSGLSMFDLGQVLFSYYDGQDYSRSNSLEYYTQIGDLYDGLLLSTPNQYMYAYLDGYQDMPITNAQFAYYTDLVPIVPIVLKGSISYYTPYLNFNALGIDRLLSMIDFGVNPSYVLTYEPTYKMRYTLSNDFYSTEFDDYKEEVVANYNYLNNALKYVINAQITDREMVYTGVAKVTYSNGVVIFVNYRQQNYVAQHEGEYVTIASKDYKVVMPS